MAFEYIGAVSYKQRKEEFVSNLFGTTMLEIAATCAIVPAFVVLRQWGFPFFLQELNKDFAATRISGWRRPWLTLTLDFLFVVLPTLGCSTIFADQIFACTTCILCLLMMVLFTKWKKLQSVGVSHSKEEHTPSAHQKMFISSYRFVVMLVTCVSILAVDFTVYPRRYAKTETYGTSLQMDVGVGSFVVTNALVSRQARNLPPSRYGGILRNTSPLLVMGFARLFLTKGIDYQVHVGEYGVHWNFFFTLAAVALLTSLIHIPAQYCGIFGLLILSAYQVILVCGLNQYLNSATRGPSILSLNKEGVFSLFGYWGLYMVSVRLGHYLFHECGNYVGIFFKAHNSVKDDTAAQKFRSAVEIWVLCAFFWIVAVLLDTYIERVSRRTCNMAYVMLVLAVNFEGIGILFLSEFIPVTKNLLVEEIFNQNLLGTFLLANVLTGLVNVNMDTLSASDSVAHIILTSYLAALVIGMVSMKNLHLKVKVW